MQVIVSTGNSVSSAGVVYKPGDAVEIDDAEAVGMLRRGVVRLPPVTFPPDPNAAYLPADVVAKRRVAAIAAAEAQQLAALGLTKEQLGIRETRNSSVTTPGVPWW